MELLLKLLLAHLLGDFILQPMGWVKAKETQKLRSPILYVHSMFHGALSLLLVWDIDFLGWAILIAASHLLIDGGKLMLQTKANASRLFFIDQALHLAVIAGIWLYLQMPEWPLWIEIDPIRALLYLTAIAFLTIPSSVLVKILMAKWTIDIVAIETGSLANAGMYIGILERLFVFAFVLSGHWEAVGFLIAAKSVFRFGDLREAKDRKLTEYILIGTLLSFGLAFIAAKMVIFMQVLYDVNF
jgi:hypothetical protein